MATSESYVARAELCGLYAYAGREWVVERMRQTIGAAVTDSVHNHNFAWRETHVDCVGRAQGCHPCLPGASAVSWAVRWVMTP